MSYNPHRAGMRVVLAVLALAVFAGGCGGTSSDDAVEAFTEEGYTNESARCIMDEIEAGGFDADDVADPIEPGVLPVIEVAVPECIRDEDLPGILRVETMSQVEGILIDQLVGTGVLDAQQARCLIDEVQARGFGLVDINGMRANPESEQVLTDVTTQCTATA